MQKLPPAPRLTPALDGSIDTDELKRGYLRLKAWGQTAASRATRLQEHIRDLEEIKARCLAGS
jgi:hypothetical protein